MTLYVIYELVINCDGTAKESFVNILGVVKNREKAKYIERNCEPRGCCCSRVEIEEIELDVIDDEVKARVFDSVTSIVDEE